nr:D-ala D-ala ligase C-terminus [uncultured bacterium]
MLGNDAPIASLPGEIIPNHEFYSYEAKYTDDGATLKAPATLSPAVTKNIQALAIQAFQTLCCDGMARVDFFLRNNEEIIINELNTIPGFTTTSMYPRMWQSSGIHYPDVIYKLIELALEKFESEAVLKTDYVE